MICKNYISLYRVTVDIYTLMKGDTYDNCGRDDETCGAF